MQLRVMNDLFTSMKKAGLAGFHMAADREAGEDAGDRRQHGQIIWRVLSYLWLGE